MKGFTLVEILIALVIIGAVLLPLGKFYSVISAGLAERQQRTTAIRTLESQEAMLRQTPYADLPAETLELPVTELPGGRESVSFSPLPGLAATRVAIQLKWQGPAGERRMQHELVLSPYGPKP